MAIGLARMFGILLPVNFYSPYKANSIIEFWRRWHITLSRFLRDYLYIPLGGNQKGQLHRYLNLMITMLLGGLWHGAGWTFILWGGMHGVFLTINHAWVFLVRKLFGHHKRMPYTSIIAGRFLTFFAVIIAWVMFRAESLNGATRMYSGMFGYNGISLPPWVESALGNSAETFKTLGFVYNGMFHNGIFGNAVSGIALLFVMLIIVFFLPNTLDWLRNEKSALSLDRFLTKEKTKLAWSPSVAHLIFIALITVIAIMLIQQESEFLYFQF